ncbi:MAG TPA: response regulator, partial [Labilithrix sp.]|nr:response regulator [Labilithrix sp.]
TGLGLALSKRLLEMHGGTIRVTSEYGKGSVFTLTLPILRRVNASESPRSFGAADDGDLHVLIVEDDTSSAELIAGHLRAAGASVAVATHGEEAMRLALERQPRAITLDLLLPGDGWSTLRRLKEDPRTRSIPLVVISVLDEAPRALALGADGYLVKPVGREALLHLVESMNVPLFRVTGVNVLLFGEDGPELLDVWERLHQAGCRIERANPLGELMLGRQADIAVAIERRESSGSIAFSAVARAGALQVPVLVYGAGQALMAQDGIFVLHPHEIRRSELLVRRLREVLDRGPLNSMQS